MNLDSEPRNSENAPIFPIIIAAILVVCGWLATLILLSGVEDRGTFGDMFGAANAGFSGLAFVGIIYAIFIQRSEVRVAKSELKITRSIFSEQIKQMQLENLETEKRGFEDTFFRLLNQMNNVIESTTLAKHISQGTERSTKILSGRSALHDVSRMCLRNIREEGSETNLDQAYKNIFDFGTQTLPIINSVVEIMHFVDNSSAEDKQFYIRILSASLGPEIFYILILYSAGSGKESTAHILFSKYKLFKDFYIPKRYAHFRDYFESDVTSTQRSEKEFSPPVRLHGN